MAFIFSTFLCMVRHFTISEFWNLDFRQKKFYNIDYWTRSSPVNAKRRKRERGDGLSRKGERQSGKNRETSFGKQKTFVISPQLNWRPVQASDLRLAFLEGNAISAKGGWSLHWWSPVETKHRIFCHEQCDQIGRFIGLWATFQSLWQQLICPILPHS